MKANKWFTVASFLCTVALAGGSARVIYVDAGAGGAGDGSSWADAYPYLQDALAEAAIRSEPVEIRVAQGVYRPDQGAGIAPGDQAATFQLLNGVTLKGGYAGVTSLDPNARDIELYETILSGDLDGNDQSSSADYRDNSCHIVTCRFVDDTAVIEGFSLTRGVSLFVCKDGYDNAGAMLIEGGSPVVRRSCFSGSSVICGQSAATLVACTFERGGSVYNRDSDPVLLDCCFNDASVSNLESAPSLTNCRFEGSVNHAMHNDFGSSPSLTDCAFTGYHVTAVQNGTGSDAAFANCRFESNKWTTIENGPGSRVVLTACTFTDNEYYGMWGSDCNSVLTDCVFERNGRFPFGGGAIHWSRGELIILDCTFIENEDCAIHSVGTLIARSCVFWANTGFRSGAISHTGRAVLRDCKFIANSNAAIHTSGDQLMATGCIFAGNSGTGWGGAIHNASSLLRLTNCTFAGNRGTPSTIWHRGTLGSVAELTQCIVWDGSTPFRGYGEEEPGILIKYSDVRGGYPGEGNVDVDPCFVEPGYWAAPNDPDVELGPDDPKAVWVNGDYHLKSQAGHWDRSGGTWVRDEVTSACIDAGEPNAPIGSEPFPNGAVVNLGAYGGTREASKSHFGEPDNGPVFRSRMPR